MSWILNFTNCKCRIYRPYQLAQHSGMPKWSDFEDIYSEDKYARLMPQSEGIINLGAVSSPSEIGTAILERTVDVDVGFILEIKKLRTVEGVREPVTANVASAASATDTTLTVDEIYGFEAGDICVVEESTTWDVFKLKSAAGTTLTTYAQYALANSYTTAADVAVKSLWVVESEIIPQFVGPYHKVMVRHLPGYWQP